MTALDNAGGDSSGWAAALLLKDLSSNPFPFAHSWPLRFFLLPQKLLQSKWCSREALVQILGYRLLWKVIDRSKSKNSHNESIEDWEEANIEAC